MSKREKNSSRGHVFEQEALMLEHATSVSSQASQLPKQQLAEEYRQLMEQYEQLVGDARLVTSVSDRLQNKLNNANEQIMAQNEKLRQTIQLLQEARVGKKALTIVLLLAVLLFLISEAFIEPRIEAVVDDWYIGLLLKGLIAVLLKPLESIVEKLLYQRTIRKAPEK
jgi:hypothetical protein